MDILPNGKILLYFGNSIKPKTCHLSKLDVVRVFEDSVALLGDHLKSLNLKKEVFFYIPSMEPNLFVEPEKLNKASSIILPFHLFVESTIVSKFADVGRLSKTSKSLFMSTKHRFERCDHRLGQTAW